MSDWKMKSFVSLSPTDDRYQAQREQFEKLCSWIDLHLDEPIGWQELMEQSGWDYQTIQTLFYRHKCATAMTWIRLRRQARTTPNSLLRRPMALAGTKPSQP